MNGIGSSDHPIGSQVWEGSEMRTALAARDISAVYRMLRRVGISQRQIAALTGQSQSEVSEILKGRRVMAYDVLVRIADGLGAPRGYLGLAYDEATAASVVELAHDARVGAHEQEDESVKRRKFVAHAAAVTFGTAVLGTDSGEWMPSRTQTPTPDRIGVPDVRQVEATTRALRALDYQFGGGGCRDAVLAQLSASERMLSASSSDAVRTHLFRALADLHNLAGWTTFDVGMLDASRDHFAKALQFARESGDQGLMSNVLYRMGRVYLHDRAPNDALKLFQLGQIAAQGSGSQLAVAVLCTNEAWAYAMMADEDQTNKLLGRARDEFARAHLDEAPDWVRFFDETDLHAMVGTVHTELSSRDVTHSTVAIPALTTALGGYTDAMNRSRAFTLTALATNHLRQGDVDEGVRVGRDAVELVGTVKSARVVDRLEPLQQESERRAASSDAGDLAASIRALRTG